MLSSKYNKKLQKFEKLVVSFIIRLICCINLEKISQGSKNKCAKILAFIKSSASLSGPSESESHHPASSSEAELRS